jgi:hypothetical protein
LFFERRDAQDLKHRMQRQRQVEPLSNDGDEHVHADSDPHLGLDRVLGCAEEALDPQVLLDPFEQLGDILPMNSGPLKSEFTTDFTLYADGLFRSSGCITFMRRPVMS